MSLLALDDCLLAHVALHLFPDWSWRFDVSRELLRAWHPRRLLKVATRPARLVEANWRLIRFAPEAVRADLPLLERLAQVDGRTIRYAAEPLKLLERAPALLRCCDASVTGDRAAALVCVRHHGAALRLFDERFRMDREVVELAIETEPFMLKLCAKHYGDDEAMVLRAVGRQGQLLRYASQRLRALSHVVIAAVANGNCPSAWQWALGEAARDPFVVEAALLGSSMALKYAPEDLRDDYATALRAVHLNAFAMHYVSQRLAKDRRLIRAAVEQHPRVVCMCLAVAADDAELMGLAVAACGSLLEFASPRLRGDRGLVLSAVSAYGLALQFASPELRDDYAVVTVAIHSRGGAWAHASARLRACPELARLALTRDAAGSALAIAASSPPGLFDELLIDAVGAAPELVGALPMLRTVRRAVLSAVQYRGRALAWAPAFADDDLVAAVAVDSDGDALAYVSERLRARRELVLRAVRSSPEALRFASAELRDDPMIVRHAVEHHYSALAYASETLRSDASFIEELLERPRNILMYASASARADRRIVAKSARIFVHSFKFADEALRDDAAFVAELLRDSPGIVRYCSARLRALPEVMHVAIRQDADFYEFALGEAAYGDYALLEALLRESGHLVQYVPSEVLDRHLALLAVRRSPRALGCLPEAFKCRHLEVSLVALQGDPSVIVYVPSSQWSLADVVALSRDPSGAMDEARYGH